MEIASFREIHELTCKFCGTINPIEDITFEEWFQKDFKRRIRALCPDCGSFLRFMPVTAFGTVYDMLTKKSVEVSTAPDSLLNFHLRKTKNNQDIINEIDRRVKKSIAWFELYNEAKKRLAVFKVV